MYKVFTNSGVVVFVPIAQIDPQLINNKSVLLVKENHFSDKKISSLLKNDNQIKIIIAKNINKTFAAFCSHFKKINAGGGLVSNSKKEILFIYRRGKWDLPKGKIDKGETTLEGSIREVKEECGISKLVAGVHFSNTYHIYKIKKRNVIKKTSWFEMKISGKQKLVPQLSEEITALKFIAPIKFVSKYKRKTFPLIIDLVQQLCK